MVGYELSGPTIEFIRHIDEVFDMLNVRSKYGKHSKAPLTKMSYDIFVDESLNAAGDGKNIPESFEQRKNRLQVYIRSLKLVNDQPILKTRKHTGFTGFINGLESLFHMGKYLIFEIKDPLEYVLSFKLSQDHLETFFSLIRSRNGCCVNPTCVQFMAAFKALLMRAEIKISTGNCTLLQIIPILNPLENKKKTKAIKGCQPKNFEDEDNFEEIDSAHHFFSSVQNVEFKVNKNYTFKLFSKFIAEYIANFEN